MSKPILIVMLTHNDQTVKNAPEVFEAAKDAPTQYWGMKDEGLEEEKMVALFKRMKECGKTTFLEIVADDLEVETESVRLAVRVARRRLSVSGLLHGGVRRFPGALCGALGGLSRFLGRLGGLLRLYGVHPGSAGNIHLS